MKKPALLFLICIAVFITTKCSSLKLAHKYYLSPCYYDKPEKQSDFDQVFIEVDLEAYYQRITNLASDLLQIDTIASIAYKNEAYPILSLTNTPLRYDANHKKLLIIAGVHGNESGGTLAIIDFLKILQEEPDILDGWSIKIITPVNPAGTIEMSRYNECGCDLNRKVFSSKQPGIMIQREAIQNFNPHIIISLHEAPAEGFLIHSNEHIHQETLINILDDIKRNGITLANKDYLGRSLKVPGNSKVKGHLKILKKIARVQTLGDYASRKKIIEITTESGWNSQDTVQRTMSHVNAIISVMKHAIEI